MIEQSISQQTNHYKDIYSQLYSALKWKADKRSLMLISAMYVTSSKEFQLKSYLELCDYIKSEVGMFSHLKSAQRFTTAAVLDTTTFDPKSNFHHFLTIYEKLIENGFGRNVFSYVAAGTLLKVEEGRMDEYIQKSNDIYKGMKNHHFFLTNSSDYPLAAILSQSEKNSDDLLHYMEDFYQSLKQKGFSIGNDLQFLSHILALDSSHNPNEKAEQCLKIKNLLQNENIKVKKMYYPYIGILTYLESIESEIGTLSEIYNKLNDEKLFKWNKDINFMLSILFLMNQYTTLGEATKTGINTTIEILIQASQAAMTASITAATAASASNSGNS